MKQFEMNRNYLNIKYRGCGWDQYAKITIFKPVKRTEKFLTVEIKHIAVFYTGADEYRGITLEQKVQKTIENAELWNSTEIFKTRGKIDTDYKETTEMISVKLYKDSCSKELLYADDKIID
jgi:hypothetical protein